MTKLENSFYTDQESLTTTWEIPKIGDIVRKDIILEHDISDKELELAKKCSKAFGVIVLCVYKVATYGDGSCNTELVQTFRLYGTKDRVKMFSRHFRGIYDIVTKVKKKAEGYKLRKPSKTLVKRLMNKTLDDKLELLRKANTHPEKVKNHEKYMREIFSYVCQMDGINFKKYTVTSDLDKKIKCADTKDFKHRRVLRWN